MKKRFFTISVLILIIVLCTVVFASCDELFSTVEGFLPNNSNSTNNNETTSKIPDTSEKALKKLENLGFKIYYEDSDEDFDDVGKYVEYYKTVSGCEIFVYDCDKESELYDLYGSTGSAFGYIYYFVTEEDYNDLKDEFDLNGSEPSFVEKIDDVYYTYFDIDKKDAWVTYFCDDSKLFFQGYILLWEEFSK